MTRDARKLLADLVGTTVFTLAQRKPNRIIAIRGSDVWVDAGRGEKPVRIDWVQDALDMLIERGEVKVDVETVGYRSAFIGAVLATLPGAVVETNPRRVRMAEFDASLGVM